MEGWVGFLRQASLWRMRTCPIWAVRKGRREEVTTSYPPSPLPSSLPAYPSPGHCQKSQAVAMLHHLAQRRPFNRVLHSMARTKRLLDLAFEGEGDGRIEQRAVEGLVGDGDD